MVRRWINPSVALVLVAACSGGSPGGGAATRTQASDSTQFTVDYPAQGAVVTSDPVAVGGRAPAGARVVQDISFAFDNDVIAATTGRWEMLVDVEEGANELVFRLGDDHDTEIRLGITYQPSAAPTNPPGGGPTAAPPTGGPPAATPQPTPKPEPTPSFLTFGDGIWEVGVDIKAGTYRLREPAFFCYWARLRGFGGSLNDIIANGNENDAYGVVTIRSSDAGFESSGCGEWSSDLSRVTNDKSHIDHDGTYIVGTDISPGKWRSSGGDGICYWARVSAFTGTLGAIIANGLPDGRTIVTIRSTDKGFVTTGCGSWVRQ